MIRVPIALAFVLLISQPIFAETQSPGPFPDVPTSHWAASAVKQMSDTGIMKGYPDGQFKGDKPVTRFELAVALERLVKVVESSRTPLAPKKPASVDKPTAQPPAPKLQVPAPASPASSLVSGGFLPATTPLLKDSAKTVDTKLLAESLASIAARLAFLDADREAEQSRQPQANPKESR
jgi:hypothetical protein